MSRWNYPKWDSCRLNWTDIGTSIKISSVNLPENVIPTITDRDFVVATVAAPTVIKEPEKPAEETIKPKVKHQQKERAAQNGEPAKKDEKGKDGAAEKKSDDKKTPEKNLLKRNK